MNNTLVPFRDDDYPDRFARHRSLRVMRAAQRAEMEVMLHDIWIGKAVAKDGQEAGAIADVVTAAAKEEMSFIDYGIAQANGSAAKLEIVARLANVQQAADSRRLLRNWGR